MALEVLSRGRPDLAEEIIPNLLAVTQPSEIQSAAAGPSVAPAGHRWPQRPSTAGRISHSRRAESYCPPWPVRACWRKPSSKLSSSRRSPPASSMPRFARRWSACPMPCSGNARRPSWPGLPRRERSGRWRRYQSALELVADERRGAAVFARNCQTCHQRQGQGHRVGPDLSGIAGRAPDALLIDVLDPNREVVADYITLSWPRGAARSSRDCSSKRPPRPEAPPRRRYRGNHSPVRDRRASLDRAVPHAGRTRAIHQSPGDGRPDRILAGREMNPLKLETGHEGNGWVGQSRSEVRPLPSKPSGSFAVETF